MRNRILLTCLVSAALTALPSTTAAAQLRTRHPGRFLDVASPYPASGGGMTFEAFYSHYRLAGRDRRIGADGLGGRLLWQPMSALGMDSTRLAARTSLGAFAVYTPAQRLGFSTLHVGAEADVRPLGAPLFGRVDPILSLGAGAFRTRVDDASAAAATRFPLAARTSTNLALTPGFGARVGLLSRIGLRADVRDVITFRDATRHNVEVAAGLSLPL
jgi:hypothetical protein